MRRPWFIVAAVALAAAFVCSPPVIGADLSRRVAERGPSAFIVGTVFTFVSGTGLVMAKLQGRPTGQPACRFEHGLLMLAVSPLVVPAGLVLTPLHPHGAASLWFDGLVDAFQEDYCTRPATSILP